MTENQRETFRVDAAPELEGELFYEGRVAPCQMENLSAGGARIETDVEMTVGSRCTLGVRLRGELQAAASREYVSFLMEVLETTPLPQGGHDVRMRNATAPGSATHEAMVKLVFEAHRRWLAARSGAGQASPMVSDPERRAKHAPTSPPRFTKRSLRPGQGD